MAMDCCWNCKYFIPSPRNNAGEYISHKIPICILNRKEGITPEAEGLSEGDIRVEANQICDEYEEKEYDRETSRRVTEAAFKLCEESGDIKEVNADFYEGFISIPDEFIIQMICTILANRHDEFMKSLETKWETEEEMFSFVKGYLWLIAKGILGFREKDMKFVMFKPVGPPPEGDILERLEEKIDNADELIIKALQRAASVEKKNKNNDTDLEK